MMMMNDNLILESSMCWKELAMSFGNIFLLKMYTWEGEFHAELYCTKATRGSLLVGWCNPTPQEHWIEDSKKIEPEMREKALGFS